jgi:hypothetical protein
MSLIVVITNKSQLKPISDYNYEVLIGDGTEAGSKSIAHGKVYGHHRAEGWKVLVDRVLEAERDKTS